MEGSRSLLPIIGFVRANVISCDKVHLCALDIQNQWTDSVHMLKIFCTGSVGVQRSIIFDKIAKKTWVAWNLVDFNNDNNNNGVFS